MYRTGAYMVAGAMAIGRREVQYAHEPGAEFTGSAKIHERRGTAGADCR